MVWQKVYMLICFTCDIALTIQLKQSIAESKVPLSWRMYRRRWWSEGSAICLRNAGYLRIRNLRCSQPWLYQVMQKQQRQFGMYSDTCHMSPLWRTTVPLLMQCSIIQKGFGAGWMYYNSTPNIFSHELARKLICWQFSWNLQ